MLETAQSEDRDSGRFAILLVVALAVRLMMWGLVDLGILEPTI